MLHAGFHVADITPPAGSVGPGGFAPSYRKGAHDPLRVRAGVFLGEDSALAVVGVDAVSIKAEDADSAREMAGDLSPVPADNIIIAASHAHTGGPSNDVLGSPSDAHYREQIVRQVASAVAEAARTAVPAEIAWASGTAEGLAWNRRWHLADGSQGTHCDPSEEDVIERAGPDDPEVLLLAARAADDGRMLGFAGNFTCHPTIMGGPLFSAGYPGAWSDAMATATGGAPLIFLNGAMGDVTQVNRELDRPQKGIEGVRRFARKLSGESLKLLAEMQFVDEAPIMVVTETLRVDFRHPTEEQRARDRETDAEATEDDYSREVVFARSRLALAEHIEAHDEEPVPLTCARIGDLAIAAGPGQMFCEFGLDCKARSPFEHTMYVTLANGNAGYVPTAEAIATGGYEPVLRLGSRLAPEAGGQIVDAQVKLLEKLA